MIAIVSLGTFVGIALVVLAIAGIASLFGRSPPSRRRFDFDPKRPHALDKYLK